MCRKMGTCHGEIYCGEPTSVITLWGGKKREREKLHCDCGWNAVRKEAYCCTNPTEKNLKQNTPMF